MLRQIIDKLRDIRKSRGLTQAAVYEDTSVQVSKYEVGYMNMSITTIAILCEYFDISLEEFFKGITPSKNLSL